MFTWKFRDLKRAIEGKLTLEEVLSEMCQLLGEESLNHHRMGQLYNYVVDNKLAEAEGYKNAADYFRQKLSDVSQATLSMYAVVAAHFSEETARRFGVTCLARLLTYKEAAAVKVDHEQPGNTPIEVLGKNGAVETKPFGACTVDDMRRALQRLRKPASSQPLPEQDLKLVEQYRAAVTGCFDTKEPVRVQVRNLQGTPVVDFKGIPLAQVARLAEALMAPLTAPQDAGVEQIQPPA